MNINLKKIRFLLLVTCIWNMTNRCDEAFSIPLINIDITRQEKPIPSDQLMIIEKVAQEEIDATIPEEQIVARGFASEETSFISIEAEPQADITRSQLRVLYSRATAMIEQIINGIRERLNALYEWSTTIQFNPIHNPYIDEDYLDEYKP